MPPYRRELAHAATWRLRGALVRSRAERLRRFGDGFCGRGGKLKGQRRLVRSCRSLVAMEEVGEVAVRKASSLWVPQRVGPRFQYVVFGGVRP